MEEDQQTGVERSAEGHDGAIPSQDSQPPEDVGEKLTATESVAGFLDRAHAAMETGDPLLTRDSPINSESLQPNPRTDDDSTDTAQMPQHLVIVPNLSQSMTESHNALETVLAAGHATERIPEEMPVPQVEEQHHIFSDTSMLHEVSSLPPLENGTSFSEAPYFESAASVAEMEGPRIQAFAKLEFDDMVHYMSTYSVEIGRDTGAEKLAMQHDLEINQNPEDKPRKRSTSSGEARQVSRKLRREGSWKMAGSVISESGGIMGPDMHAVEPRRKLKSKKSKSTSSSSYNMSRRSSSNVMAPQPNRQNSISTSRVQSTYGAHPVDTHSLMPSPEGCPFIKIHPPTIPGAGTKGYRGISRMHAKIAYNFEKRLFEIKITGRNGAFVDEQHYREGEVQELKSGSYVQIGGVGMKFVLPDVALGETGAEGIAESDGISGGAMSFDFEDGRGESVIMADDSDTSSTSGNKESSRDLDNEEWVDGPDGNSNIQYLKSEAEELKAKGLWGKLPLESEEEDRDEGEDEEDDDDEEEDEEEEQGDEKEVKLPTKQKAKSRWEYSSTRPKPKLKVEPITLPVKRKGPGRPPKNGIISKREQALLARQAKEAAKAEAIKNGVLKPTKGKEGSSGKVGQAVKDEEPNLQPEKTEKRKYTKRKKAEIKAEEPSDIRETTEKTESMPPEQSLVQNAPPKPPKEKKSAKPPRSPSPVWDESTLTPEQLAKPSQSYVVLIHEALSNSPTGAMSLPQIYRAIERRYPFYKLRVQTQGWQSSVRHNLSQHAAFRKITRDGKGWMWGLVPEISIEKEKKRRPSPPTMPPQGYYPPPPHYYHHPYGHPGGHPGMPTSNGHAPNGYPPYPMHAGMAPIPGQPMPLQHPGPPRGPNNLPLPLATPLNSASSEYQSPYQPPPPSQPSPIPPPPTSSQPPPPTQPSPNELPQEPPPKPQNAPTNSQTAPTQPQQSQAQTHHPTPSPAPTPHQPSTHLPSPSPQPPPNPTPNKPNPLQNISQDVLTAVSKFKSALISSLPANPNAEKIVTSAIDRTLGIASSSSAPGGTEYPEEKPIMQALSTLLDSMREKASRSVGVQQQVQKAPAPPGFHGPSTSTQSPSLQHQQQPLAHTQQQQQLQPSLNRPSASPATQQAQLLSFLQQIRGPLSSSQPQTSPQDPMAEAGLQVPGTGMNGISGSAEDNDPRGVKRALEESVQDEAGGVGGGGGGKRVAV